MDQFWALIVAEVFTQSNLWRPNQAWGGSAVAKPFMTWGPKEGCPQCQGSILEEGSNFTRRHQCERPAKVILADGRGWCGVHSPEAVQRRAQQAQTRTDAHMAKWRAQRTVAEKEAAQRKAYPRLITALREIAAGHNDPRTLARELLIEVGETVDTQDVTS